jgi:hypothetical protein
MYVNGTQSGSSYTDTQNIATAAIKIGANYNLGAVSNGYISNFRILKGEGLYTTTFTPPQSVLPSITNTQLLLNVIDSANFITDNSPNAFAVTNNGTVAWTASGPFNS